MLSHYARAKDNYWALLYCRDRCREHADVHSRGSREEDLRLPDGNIISVGDEHFRYPEVQFFTRFSDEKASEICYAIFLSIMARHFRGDSGCFVSVSYETHEGLCDKAHRGRTAQPMFGMFNVLAAPVATQADWYLSALRRATGIVTDSCDDGEVVQRQLRKVPFKLPTTFLFSSVHIDNLKMMFRFFLHLVTTTVLPHRTMNTAHAPTSAC